MFTVSCGETGHQPTRFEGAWSEHDVRRARGRVAGRQRLRLTGGEKDWRDYLDVILDPISNMARWRSVNTKARRWTRVTRPRSRLQEGFTKGPCVISPGVY